MRNINKVYIIDVECTCWNDNDPKQGDFQEIIQIGYITLDIKNHSILHALDRGEIIVRPTINTELSEFCTQLTGLTQGRIDLGITFAEAIKQIKKWDPAHDMWASWGYYDVDMFKSQCARENIRYPFSNLHLNLKALFAAQFGKKASVGKALEYLGMEFRGRPHDGKDDAYNIARIYSKIFWG